MSVKVVLGCMGFKAVADEAAAASMTKKFIDAGHNELDTAIMYWDSQKVIGRFPKEIKDKAVLHTKFHPYFQSDVPHGLTPASINNQAKISIEALNITPNVSNPPIDILYLHSPDHTNPIEASLRTMHELYKQGVYRRLGLSNYASWQVMQAYKICEHNGWVLPSVYQGVYNAITRSTESELIPCLRALKISFYVFNPLAGGMLSGKYQFDEQPSEPGRFNGHVWAEHYRQRYWKKQNFDALDSIKATLNEVYGNEVNLTQASLRWVIHHSALKGEFGDAMIIGASNMHHLEENLAACAGGPLDERVLKAFQSAWEATKSECQAYYR